MKKLIIYVLKKLGYEIHTINKSNLEVYRLLYNKDSLDNRRFYNIGAGNFSHPFWTNIDYISDWYKSNTKYTAQGIHYDLLSLKPMPIDSNIGEIIYSSHTIEHITNEAAQNMFSESYRILKPGGVLRLITPNIDLEYRAYQDNDRHYFYWINEYSKPNNIKRVKLSKPMNQASIGEIFLHHFATSVSPLNNLGTRKITDDELSSIFKELSYIDALNYCISQCSIEIQKENPGNHINWWNKDKLFTMLEKAGFKNVYLSGWGQSVSPILRETFLFDKTHPPISIYVEAIK